MVTRLLTEADHARIAEAVKAAEARTAVELRLVLAHWSSRYGAIALICPTMAALVAGGVAAALRPALPAVWLWLGQGAIFLVLLGLTQWPALRRALTPPAVKRKAAWRQARLHYASIGLKQPHIRNALLLFCSAAEHSVEILVDDAIAEKLPRPVWEPVVARFKTDFAAGRIVEAYVEAAAACAAILEPVFPAAPGQGSEIPDTLVEV